ncbi:MAG: hypothetical protein FJ387_23635 [Verrucomicrobia bacterium]|nr:hypothetical protein [Verrucomicrobiota bacterium]
MRQAAPAGLSTLRAPLGLGTPAFRLLRGGSAVLSMTSPWTVQGEADFQDLLYRAVSSFREPTIPGGEGTIEVLKK